MLRSILHLGLYQLQFQERIPPSAAVNTTVQLAKDNGFSGLSGFVNGLLRSYIRLGEERLEGERGRQGDKVKFARKHQRTEHLVSNCYDIATNINAVNYCVN